MVRLRKFWTLSRRQKQFIFEAAALLPIVNLCVRTVPFRYVHRFLNGFWIAGARRNHDRNVVDLTRVAVSQAARVLPLTGLCLTHSIVTYIMLRRRGVPAVLFAGIKISGDSILNAHAWVQSDHSLIGQAAGNAEFTPIMIIGDQPPSAAST